MTNPPQPCPIGMSKSLVGKCGGKRVILWGRVCARGLDAAIVTIVLFLIVTCVVGASSEAPFFETWWGRHLFVLLLGSLALAVLVGAGLPLRRWVRVPLDQLPELDAASDGAGPEDRSGPAHPAARRGSPGGGYRCSPAGRALLPRRETSAESMPGTNTSSNRKRAANASIPPPWRPRRCPTTRTSPRPPTWRRSSISCPAPSKPRDTDAVEIAPKPLAAVRSGFLPSEVEQAGAVEFLGHCRNRPAGLAGGVSSKGRTPRLWKRKLPGPSG